MNPWKISTLVLSLAVVGLLGLSATNGEGLQGSFGSGMGASVDIMTAVEDVHDEIGYSTWTLEAAVQKDYQNYAGTINYMVDHIGNSSWTLDALAEQMYDICK